MKASVSAPRPRRLPRRACTTASGRHGAAAAPPAAAAAARSAAAPTAAEADAFVARAEKELAEFTVINSRAQWVNATYITDDTDALAAHFGTIGTEMSVRFANEAARYANVPGLDYDTGASSTSCAARWCCRRRPRPAPPPSSTRISTRLSARTYGKGRGTLDGKPMTGNDLEEKMGTVRNPAQLKEMWTSWHTNVGRADARRNMPA